MSEIPSVVYIKHHSGMPLASWENVRFRPRIIRKDWRLAVIKDGRYIDAAYNDLGDYQLRSEKNQASGYAGLNSGSHVGVAYLGSGTPGITTYLRGDGAWVVPSVVVAHAILDGSVHTDSAAGAVARGALIVGQGETPKWTRLLIGTSGKYLRSDGTDAGWSAIGSADLPDLSGTYSVVGHTHAGVYDPAGTAAGLMSTHTSTYDHTLLHAAVTLAVSADVLLGLTGQALSLDTQVKNKVLAGPITGVDAAPTFRVLDAADVPDLSGTYSILAHTHAAYLNKDGTVALTGNWVQSGVFAIRTAGYMRVGSSAAPTNVTAGDLSSVRLFVGTNAAITAGYIADVVGMVRTIGSRNDGVKIATPSANQLLVASTVILANAEVVTITSAGDITLAPATYSSIVLALTPGAYWRCSEAAGNLADSTANANTAVAHGPAITYSVAGAILNDSDTAISLPALAADYFEAANSASLDVGNTFSIIAWFKKAADGVQETIISRGNTGYQIGFQANNRVYLAKNRFPDPIIVIGYSSLPAITGTAWHMLVVTKAGVGASSYKIYIDGADRTTSMGDQTLIATGGVTQLGQDPLGVSLPWGGSLDEMAVFNYVLTPAQIAAIYTRGMGGPPTIADGYQGQIVSILNDGAATITLQDQGTLAYSNLRLSANTVALGPRDSVQLMFNTTINDWVQIGACNVL
jgi:hypothetical protein